MSYPVTARLTLVSHAATAATRNAAFPLDESLERPESVTPSDRLRRVETIVCGPEIRCLATAERLGFEPTVESALADLNLGGWRGRTLADLQASDPAALLSWLTDPTAAPHSGESLTDLRERVTAWLDGVSGRTVAVTHPAVVRAVVVHVLDAPLSAFWRLDVAPSSYTRLSRSGPSWTLRETGHPL
ncbi:histidine phosphatase family protein [Fodinicola feengrottensis]|uniref:Histidine phosphatase family protein n=1 Tax=Fodinicola feengrottensis TaxID=435914 RepID=A0ABP4V6E9_9ACTN|nr:histidine phosphatase family protein [Fodinicola feengrottensis]